MTLSLDPSTIGCAMWSAFWTEGVPCNSAGAWFGPIADVLRPHLEANDHKTVVRILSQASRRAGPLWLGSALLGPSSLIGRIEMYLDRGRYVPCTGPDPTAAIWTGLPHSFLDGYCTRGITLKDTISRADVWRLRREFPQKYKSRDLEQPLPHSWPPFGRMRGEDWSSRSATMLFATTAGNMCRGHGATTMTTSASPPVASSCGPATSWQASSTLGGDRLVAEGRRPRDEPGAEPHRSLGQPDEHHVLLGQVPGGGGLLRDRRPPSGRSSA